MARMATTPGKLPPVPRSGEAEVVASSRRGDIVEAKSMADSDSNAPATKADVIALEERLRTDMASLEERLLQKMDDQTEKFRDMQTEMLKAFYASPRRIKRTHRHGTGHRCTEGAHVDDGSPPDPSRKAPQHAPCRLNDRALTVAPELHRRSA